MDISQAQVQRIRRQIEARFPTPSVPATLSFITQEVGELHDAAMRAGLIDPHIYTRAADKDLSVAEELGDVLAMCLTLANQLDLDAGACVANTLQKWVHRAEAHP
jgi:NTP pyrophosphatase (non-canonical NTP hydrolase)